MGEFDEYCTVCGGPPSAPSFDPDNYAGQPPPAPLPNPADYTWLDSFIGISNKEEPIPLASYDSLGSFDILESDTSPYLYFSLGHRYEDAVAKEAAKGYACHVTCYNLLQQELNYTLKHADVLPLLVDKEYQLNTFSWSDYGGLAEYHEQYFDGVDVQLVKDGKLWMVEDPSRNEQNKERILKLWRPLVESGFKKPEAKVGDDGSSAPEIAETNMDERGGLDSTTSLEGLMAVARV